MKFYSLATIFKLCCTACRHLLNASFQVYCLKKKRMSTWPWTNHLRLTSGGGSCDVAAARRYGIGWAWSILARLGIDEWKWYSRCWRRAIACTTCAPCGVTCRLVLKPGQWQPLSMCVRWAGLWVRISRTTVTCLPLPLCARAVPAEQKLGQDGPSTLDRARGVRCCENVLVLHYTW